MRVGIIGTESNHTIHYLRMLNQEARHRGIRVEGLWGTDPKLTRELADTYQVADVVDAPDDLLGKVDAVIVADRHGDDHRPHAVPFLSAGTPVFVDKPLACSVTDAEAVIAAARSRGTPVMSLSALRYQPDTQRLGADIADIGEPRVVVATGQAAPDSPFGGAIFYGIHTVELALELAGGGCVEDIHVQSDTDSVTVTAQVNQAQVVIGLVRPAPGAKMPFCAHIVGRGGAVSGRIDVGPDYLAPVLDRFVGMLRTGEVPLTADEMLTSVRIAAAVNEVWSVHHP